MSQTSWQRTLWIIFFAQLITAIGFSSIFPFLPLYVESLGASSSLSIEFLAGMVYSGQAITMMITAPFWGALADRYGRKIMVERAMFGGAVIILFMAFVQTAEQLVLLRAIQGLVTGTVAAANALVAAVVPRHRSGYAMGLLQVGTGSGVALGPMLGGLIADAFGYAPTFYVTSCLLLLGGLLVMVGIKEHFAPAEEAKRNRPSLLSKWKQVLNSTGVLVTFGMRFLTQMGRMMIVPVIPLFVLELMPGSEHVNTFTGLTVGAASVTTTLSAIFLGRLGDRREWTGSACGGRRCRS